MTGGAVAAHSSRPPGLAPIPVAAIAFGAVAILLVFGGSGYHRDELYFLEASKHLAWGYVDQPPLSVALVGLSHLLFGNSLVGLRLFPALADGLMVVFTALIARELGGDRFAQVLSGLAVGLSPFLIAAHLAGPTIYDLLTWTIVSWLVVRIVRGGRERLWLAVGLVTGVALLDKETILLLVGALAIGLVANRGARMLRSPWLWAGAALALVIWSPNVVWQIRHGWPSIEMSRNLQSEHSGLGYALKFAPIQLLFPGWWVGPVWIGGLLALWRDERFRTERAFAIAYALAFVVLLITVPDRPYYLGGLYPVLFAAGSILAAEVVAGVRRFLSDRPARRRLVWRSTGTAVAWVVVVGVVNLPASLPILPASALAKVPLQGVNYNLGEVFGWPQLVATVAGVDRSLPSPERAKVAIVTGNYGEAGAIDRYGPAFGLPPAYSGHNSYWWWGPPEPALGTTLAVGFSAQQLTPYFRRVRLATRFESPSGLNNDENGAPIWVCTGQRRPWPAIWTDFRHYG